jgi:hypothetical protein
MPAIRLFRLRVFTGLCGRKEMKMSELRERIAVTIYGAASQWDSYPWDALAGHIQALYLGQADEVIRELGLQPEYGHLDETDSGIIADTIPELGEPCPGETLRHRYITPWKDINETD